jgi:chaperonin GroES
VKDGFALVKVCEPKRERESGIIYTEKGTPWTPIGHVVKLGGSAKTRLGFDKPVEMQLGDLVLFDRYAGTAFETFGTTPVVLIRQENILGVF